MKKSKWYFIVLIPLLCLGFFYTKSLRKPIKGNFDRNFVGYSVKIIDSLQFITDIFGMKISQGKIYINDGTSIRMLNFLEHTNKLLVSKNYTKEPIMSFGVDSLSIFYRISNDEKIFYK